MTDTPTPTDYQLAQKQFELLKDELQKERKLTAALSIQVEKDAVKLNRLWKLELLLKLTGFEVIEEGGRMGLRGHGVVYFPGPL